MNKVFCLVVAAVVPQGVSPVEAYVSHGLRKAG